MKEAPHPYTISVRGVKGIVRVDGRYPDGSVKASMLDMSGDLYTVITTVIAGVDVLPGQLLVRDSFENEGLVFALTQAGLGRVDRHLVRNGAHALLQVTHPGLLQEMEAAKNGPEHV